MLKRFTALIVLSTLSMNAKAQSMDELCAYDPMCKRSVNWDGSYIPPKPSMVKILTELKEPIRVIAHELGVDPRAVAGAILAENSMNVAVDDKVHDLLEKVKSNPAANIVSKLIRNKSFSLGLGQIKPESAIEAEATLAKIEKRAEYSPNHVRDEIQSPVGSIKYAAAIIRECQDAYKAKGMDVSKQPDILATIYNIGNCSALADQTAANGGKPRPNFFGVFVSRYNDEVAKIVDADRAYDDSEAKNLEKDVTNSSSKSKFVRSFKTPQKVYPFPPKCPGTGFQQGLSADYQREFARQDSEDLGDAKGDFEVIGGGVDCTMDDWSLVRTASGKSGWIKTSTLDANSGEHLADQGFIHNLFYGSGEKCDPKAGKDCVDKVKKALGDDSLKSSDPSQKTIAIKLVAAPGSKEEPNFKKFYAGCLTPDERGFNGQTSGSGKSIPKEDIMDLLKAVQDKQYAFEQKMGYNSPYDSKNPYGRYFANILQQLSQCTYVAGCEGSTTKIKEFLTEDLSKYKGYRALKTLDAKYGHFYLRAVYRPQVRIPSKPRWTQAMSQLEKKCKTLFDASSAAKKQWTDIEKGLAESDETELPEFEDFYVHNIERVCGNVDKALKPSPPPAEPDHSTEASHCPTCYNYSSPGQQYYYQALPMVDPIIAQLTSIDDDAAYFKDNTDGFGSMFQHHSNRMSLAGDARCNYDPFATAKRIESLMKQGCVENVFVPDVFLVNHLTQFSGHVLYKNFDSDDQFSFSIKKSCGGQG